ncbi:MAG: GerMN domain-containing protein [Thermoleophilia bacterium]|nr:GerMN domain-containing protein [Thermoleophilia bacterium]
MPAPNNRPARAVFGRIRSPLAFLAALLALASTAAAASAPDPRVSVYFTRGEQLAAVQRQAGERAPVEAALRALFEGPTDAERSRGFRTNIPAAAVLRSVVVRDRVATVDVSRRFTLGGRPSLHARLAQVVFTATAVDGVERVRLEVEGAVRRRLGGLELGGAVGRDVFAPAPAGGAPAPPPPPAYSTLVLQVQERLVALRYLPAGGADGLLGQQTRHAILAFQGWERVPRDGRATRALLGRLQRAAPPRPRAGSARRIEVSIARQVALLVQGPAVVRAIHVSTGARGFETPRGTYRVYRKELRSWSYPYRVWLPYASYFVRGVAFHESPDVPTYPASHGCVRVPIVEAPFVYRFATMGTRVVVW